MPLMRRVSFLGAAAIFAAASVNAQSTLSPNESSSAAFQFVADDGLGGTALSSAAADSGASPGGHGWKHEFSNNFAFEAGGGFNAPIGNDTSTAAGGPYITWGGNFTAGGGLHLSNRFSLLAEYQFMDNKLPGSLIAGVGTQGGHAHIWSLTLDPVIDLFPKRITSAYVTGGGGFYRKVTSFTEPEEAEECYYYCGIVEENETVYHFSSNQGGLNIGLGITHRMGGVYGDSKMKAFAEARYLFLDTPSVSATNGTGTTELIPVTIGLRW
jgi:hypothetical protein